jgi:hypothetical protein
VSQKNVPIRGSIESWHDFPAPTQRQGEDVSVAAQKAGGVLQQRSGTQTRTLKGSVKTFQWSNPHVALKMLVELDGGGEPQEWNIESSSPAISGYCRPNFLLPQSPGLNNRERKHVPSGS